MPEQQGQENMRCSGKKPTLCHLIHHKFPTDSLGIKHEPHQSHHNMQTFLEEDSYVIQGGDLKGGQELSLLRSIIMGNLQM